ncbi:hypothetical protein Tco_1455132 [Tanacetum coccineum]
MSSSETEYIAAAEASMEAVWMRKFIDGLGKVVPSNKEPMEMLYDNVADLFTKPMSLTKHNQHALGIGLRRASSLM